MWLTDVSIRRPIFIVMFVLALIVIGWVSRSKMPEEYNPKADIPYVTIVTTYAGAGPNEIETLISEPIEKAVSSIGNVKNVTSTSQVGVSSVVLEFQLGTNLDSAAADARDKVAAIRQMLPKDANDPVISRVDTASDPIMTIRLVGPLPAKEMRILADDIISERFGKVGGVAAVNVGGGDVREISVAVDKDRLDAYGVGIEEVVHALNAANINVPVGEIREGARDYSVRSVGEYQNIDQIADTRIYVEGKNGQPGDVVRIGDIAEVKDTIAEPDTLTRLNGRPGVAFWIQKQSGANTVTVADGIKKEIAAMEPVLPSGVHLIIATDESKFVKAALNDVNRNLLEGILLVVIIVFLFLHTARATFIVAVAIPTSLMATYIPIKAFGFTQNQMVLLALALVVGILVDDSIVILENIERHLRLKENPRDAALNGRSEIGLAAITITMVDIVVFLPIAFMGGIVGEFFRQFGITVACATAFSLLMSFTLTPMLASRWMKSEADKERDDKDMTARLSQGSSLLKDRLDLAAGILFGGLERFLNALDRKYEGILEWALHNRYLTIVIGATSLLVVGTMGVGGGPGFITHSLVRMAVAFVALLLAAIAVGVNKKSKAIAIGFGVVMAVIALTIYLPLGFDFVPQVDQGRFDVSIRTAPGTSLAATDTVARKVEALIGQLPEMKARVISVSDVSMWLPWTWGRHHKETQMGFLSSVVGAGSGGDSEIGSQGPQYAEISGQVVDKRYRKRSIQDIVQWLSRRTARIPGAELISVSAAGGEDSPDNDIQKEVQGHNTDDVIAEANRVASVMGRIPGAVDVDISSKPSLPERRVIVDRLRAAKLDMTVGQVADAVRIAIDGDTTVKFRDNGTQYPICVRYALDERNKTSDLDNMIIASKDGAPIYLKDVAQVRYDYAPTIIERKNRQRVVYVTANIAQGFQMGNLNQAIDTALRKTPIVPGTTIGTGGSTEIFLDSFAYMCLALLLAVLLVYMLMGALFESFLTPAVIMFSLPQAMIGALLALLLTGNTLSIMSMIGIIMLMGLVTKNAILLVDYTNTLRGRGKNRHEALLEAGPTRLRPILMTTCAMIGGMLPTALALSEGSESRSPMAIAVIGGLILSTMLTLIVIPVVYTIVDDMWQGFLRVFFPAAYERGKQGNWSSETPSG